jgi:hypothetical protein
MMEAKALLTSPRYSLYLFYWYKSTNTDAAHSLFLLGICRSKHAVFTPAAERQELQGKSEYKSTNTDAFTSTRVQILTHLAVQVPRACSERDGHLCVERHQRLFQVRTFLALLVQKYKY